MQVWKASLEGDTDVPGFPARTPQAQALLADAEVSAAAVRGCRDRLTAFLRRSLPRCYRKEQRELAEVLVRG